MGWSGPMTHRQYVAWIEWLSRDLDPNATYTQSSSSGSHPMAIKCDDPVKQAQAVINLFGGVGVVKGAERIMRMETKS